MAAIFIQFADPPMRERLFARIVQSLKPGGTLDPSGLHAAPARSTAPAAPAGLSHLYTEALLRDAFAELDIRRCASTTPTSSRAARTAKWRSA